MNKVGGFIVIHRQIIDWEWYRDTNTFCLFIHLLLMANYEDGRFEGKVVRRGQLITSLSSLSKKTGLSIRQTRTALEHLISTGEVTNESCPQYRVISIVNYDKYQDMRQRERQTTDKRPTNDVTNDRQQYNNNNNNINKETNINSPSENSPPTQDIWFSQFWDEYPKKVSKKDAQSAWKSLKVGPELMAKIMDGLRKWITSDQWTRDGGRFIPYPATWLRKRRWEDNIEQPVPSSPAPAPVKNVVAQNYEQRDYVPVQDDFMARQEARVLEHMRRKELGL